MFLNRWPGQLVAAADDRPEDRCRRRLLPLRQHLRPLPEAAGLLDRGSHEGAPPDCHQREGVPSQLDARIVRPGR